MTSSAEMPLRDEVMRILDEHPEGLLFETLKAEIIPPDRIDSIFLGDIVLSLVSEGIVDRHEDPATRKEVEDPTARLVPTGKKPSPADAMLTLLESAPTHDEV